MKLSRSEFKALVAEAVSHAPGLTHKQRKALLKVADTTTAVGSNFNTEPGCPAGQAFGWPPNGLGREEVDESGGRDYARSVTDFAFAYDDLRRARLGLLMQADVIEVEDA